MRGTCQNSLLTAKVTTLFPGPKRDNGKAGKVYIKAGRAEYLPPLTDDAQQRSRAPARGPRPPHINITRAPGARGGLTTLARDFTAASHLLNPRPGRLCLPSLSLRSTLSRDPPETPPPPPQAVGSPPVAPLAGSVKKAFGCALFPTRAPPPGEGTKPPGRSCGFSLGGHISHQTILACAQ